MRFAKTEPVAHENFDRQSSLNYLQLNDLVSMFVKLSTLALERYM